MLLLDKYKRKNGQKNRHILRSKKPKMKDVIGSPCGELGRIRDAQGRITDALAPEPGNAAEQDNSEYSTLISISDSDISTRPYGLGSSPIDVSMLESWFDSEGGADLETTVIENRRQAGFPDPTLRGKKRWPPSLVGTENSDPFIHTHPDINISTQTQTRQDTRQNNSTHNQQNNSTNSPPLVTQTSVQTSAKEINGAPTLTRESLKLLQAQNENESTSNRDSSNISMSRQAVQNQTLLNLTDAVNYVNAREDDEAVKQQLRQLQQQRLELPKSNASSNGSRKSLLPLVNDINVNANDDCDDLALPIPNLDKKSEMVTDWLTRIPPLLPNELQFPLTPKKTASIAKNDNCELLSSPLKRRRICRNIDSDDYEDAESPAFKSKFAKELYQQARQRRIDENDDNATTQPDVVDVNCADGGGMDVDTASNSNVSIGVTASHTSRLHQQHQQHLQKLQQMQKQQQQPTQPQRFLKPQLQQQGTTTNTTTNNGNNNGKIPILFLPMVPAIMPIIDMLSKNPAVGKFYTKTTANSGLRVQATNMDTYNAIKDALIKDDIPLHTHQAKKNKGFRFVIRNIHHSTPCSDIAEELRVHGFNVRFIRAIKHRFTAKPLNLFELEIEPTPDDAHMEILKLKYLGNQTIKVERQAKPRDPAQCHRCQAFGHTKNYCRRPFRCMKCAENHATTSCKKPMKDPTKCANCKGNHVSCYKGCPAFKKARSELVAFRGIGGGAKLRSQQQHQQQQQYHHHHQYSHQPQRQFYSQQRQANSQQQAYDNNAKSSYSWIVRNGHKSNDDSNHKDIEQRSDQHQQQQQRRQQHQTRLGQQRYQQQQQQHQRAHNTPKPANNPNRAPIALGPAGKHLAELQQLLKDKQEELKQQQQNITPVNTQEANPLTAALEQNAQLFARLESKLEKFFEAIVSLVSASSSTNTLKSSNSNSTTTAVDNDVCLY